MNAAPTATSGAAIPENPAAPEAIDPHADYFTDLVPEPYRILGLTLRPLSLGRYRLMRRFGVAFVDDDAAKADAGDLLLGVLICSMRCDEFLKFANSPGFAKEIRRWSRKIFPHPWICALPFGLGKWWRTKHAFDLREKMQLFQNYIESNSKSPRYWDESDNARLSGAHWSHSCEVVLRGQVGWTLEEINEEPLNKAIWDYYKHMESQGLIRLMTKDEIEHIDRQPTPEEAAAMEEWAAALRAAGLASADSPVTDAEISQGGAG